jgi:hypothetical protein
MIGENDLPGGVEDQDKAGESVQDVQQLTIAADRFALVFDFNLRAAWLRGYPGRTGVVSHVRRKGLNRFVSRQILPASQVGGDAYFKPAILLVLPGSAMFFLQKKNFVTTRHDDTKGEPSQYLLIIDTGEQTPSKSLQLPKLLHHQYQPSFERGITEARLPKTL